jgi:hypothetical protein
VSETDLPSVKDALSCCLKTAECDMFSYSGGIYSSDVSRFISFVLQRKRHEKVSLILTTYGGDAHAAYRLARALQSFYSANIRILIVGPCKSAGTLVAIGGNELVFGPFGELGPLDIQVTKKDDIMTVGSGLDTFQAFTILQNHAFSAFEQYMLSILEASDGAISTTTACEIASKLVAGVFAPIAAQIDPQKMGEMQRMISIAKAYGERLGQHNLRAGALDRLVEEYPSHGFIIDFKEARTLFKKATWMSAEEVVLVTELEAKGYCTLTPGSSTLFGDVSTLSGEGEEDDQNEKAKGSPENIGPNGPGGPRKSKPSKNGSRGNGSLRKGGKAAQVASIGPSTSVS